MRRAILVALGTGTIISSAAALGIGAASSVSAPPVSQREYEIALTAIESSHASGLVRCESTEAAQRETCRSTAIAEHLVRVADLEAGYRRTQQAMRAAQRAHIEARYQLDRAQCQGLSGFKRDKCLVSAHARRGRAMLEAAAPYQVRF